VQFVDALVVLGLLILLVVARALHEGIDQGRTDLRGVFVLGLLGEARPRFGDIPVAEFEVVQRLTAHRVQNRRFSGLPQ
jgi:hypothetical protein